MTQFRNTDPLSSVLTWVGLAVLLWLVYLVFRPFLIPLAWACVLASVSYPVYERLGRRGWKPAAAATLTTAAVTLVVIVPGVLVATAFVVSASGSLVWLWIALYAFVVARLVGMMYRYVGDRWLVTGHRTR
jgi:predicted PurR-regulated permease PerM